MVLKATNELAYKQGMQKAWQAFYSAQREISIRQEEAPGDGGAFSTPSSLSSISTSTSTPTASVHHYFQPAISPKAKKFFGWIRLVVLADNPLSICENEIYCEYVKLEHTDQKTLRKYVIMLADIIGLKIKKAIGKGNCIADGWSSVGVHYITVYHSWPYRSTSGEGEIKVQRALLAIQPLLDESDLGASSLADFIIATYEMYDETTEDGNHFKDLDSIPLVVAFTLDNCSVNKKAMQTVLSKPMIGAHCHRLNLACAHWTREAFGGNLQTTINQVHACMKWASTLKNRAKLREHSDYAPVMKNKTRWTGTQMMALQYSRLHKSMEVAGVFEDVDEADFEDIEDGYSRVPKKSNLLFCKGRRRGLSTNPTCRLSWNFGNG